MVEGLERSPKVGKFIFLSFSTHWGGEGKGGSMVEGRGDGKRKENDKEMGVSCL